MRKLIWLIVFLLISIVMMHDFINRIYVSYKPSAKVWQAPKVSSFEPVITDVNAQVSLYKKSYQQIKEQVNSAEKTTTQFDNKVFGNVKVSLLAIYTNDGSYALLALKEPDKPEKYHRVKKGDLFAEIYVEQITLHSIILRYAGEIKSLTLFTPQKTAKED